MQPTQKAVIVDLRTLVGTANVFSKQNMYRAMWSGQSVCTFHETLTEKKEITGNVSLLVLTTNKPIILSYTADEQEVYVTVNKMLVLDDNIQDVFLTPATPNTECVVSCNVVFRQKDTDTTNTNETTSKVGKAIVGKAKVNC